MKTERVLLDWAKSGLYKIIELFAFRTHDFFHPHHLLQNEGRQNGLAQPVLTRSIHDPMDQTNLSRKKGSIMIPCSV